MLCPLCGNPSTIYETRHFRRSTVRRERCLTCDHHFRTGETELKVLKPAIRGKTRQRADFLCKPVPRGASSNRVFRPFILK